MPKLSTDKLVGILGNDLSYNAVGKQQFLKEGVKVLKALAADLHLPTQTFKVSKNVSGIAGSGEVTLHHNRFYLTISQRFGGEDHYVLYRSCVGQKDYSGGSNNYCDVSALGSERIMTRLHALSKVL